jgi:hypothetical protein
MAHGTRENASIRTGCRTEEEASCSTHRPTKSAHQNGVRKCGRRTSSPQRTCTPRAMGHRSSFCILLIAHILALLPPANLALLLDLPSAALGCTRLPSSSAAPTKRALSPCYCRCSALSPHCHDSWPSVHPRAPHLQVSAWVRLACMHSVSRRAASRTSLPPRLNIKLLLMVCHAVRNTCRPSLHHGGCAPAYAENLF